MKFKKGNKVALICVSGMRGFDYLVYVGTLKSIRTTDDSKVVTIKAARALLPTETKDMTGREVSVDLKVFALHAWDEMTKILVQDAKDLYKRSQALVKRVQKTKG